MPVRHQTELRVEVRSKSGLLGEVREYQRDEEGRTLSSVIDEMADGVPDAIRLYFHDCPNAP